jgi:hypothetical protein
MNANIPKIGERLCEGVFGAELAVLYGWMVKRSPMPRKAIPGVIVSGIAAIAARRASGTPLQTRLSPACNSD